MRGLATGCRAASGVVGCAARRLLAQPIHGFNKFMEGINNELYLGGGQETTQRRELVGQLDGIGERWRRVCDSIKRGGNGEKNPFALGGVECGIDLVQKYEVFRE